MHKLVAMLLCILLKITALNFVVADKVTSEPSSTTQSSAVNTARGLSGYSRFHANDSLVGLTVPCTHDQKVCFQYNLLFDVKGDHCYAIEQGSRYYCHLRVNRTQFEHGSGNVVGICEEYEDPCPGYRMAYDGRCYRKEVVRDVICGCDAKPTRHFLGGMECRCTPPTPIHVEKPEEEGSCRIPDFRFPNNSISTRFEDVYPVLLLNCSSENVKCFQERKVWVPQVKGCFKFFAGIPCEKDHIVVIDPIAARKEHRVEAKCVHERGGCPQGQVRMAFDGQCHTKRDIELVISGTLSRNAFGEIFTTTDGNNGNTQWTAGPNICVLSGVHIASGAFDLGLPKPRCGGNDFTQCSLYEVESDIPKPE